ncbi:MAG TPA: hypothetical protein VFA10_03800 [Ktedonobacteraceae bacterium]|nr:hypothetical protein [Ktedonobacteraceae bacterium]
MDVIIACLAGFAIVCALVKWWKNRGRLACLVVNHEAPHEQEHEVWSFKDWATPLTSIAAGLSLLLTIAQASSTGLDGITGISLVCTAIILVLPMIYNAFFEPKGCVGVFLVFATLILGIVVCELALAATLADDEIVRNVPHATIGMFRWTMIIAAIVAPCYYYNSTKQILSKHTDEEVNGWQKILNRWRNTFVGVVNWFAAYFRPPLKPSARLYHHSATKKL